MKPLSAFPLPEPLKTPATVHFLNMVYAEIEGFRPLKLDVHLPEHREGLLPLVVFVHGGAFRMGDRAHLPPLLTEADLFHWLPRHGFAVASIDHRLSGEAIFPAQVHDVSSALRWLRRRAAEFGVDPQRVALWGESAGAHLAVMAGLTVGSELWESHEEDQEVQAVIDWYGPTDFSQRDVQLGRPAHTGMDSPEAQLMGVPIEQDPEAVQRANPCRYVHRHAPPMLIQHGAADSIVPVGQSALLFSAMKNAGAEVHFEPEANMDHVFLGHPEPERLLGRVLAFLQQHLQPEFN